MGAEIPISIPQVQPPLGEQLSDFETHPWVQITLEQYERTAIVAEQAKVTVVEAFSKLDREYGQRHGGRALFTVVEARVKDRKSYLRKLFKIYQADQKKKGMTKDNFSLCCNKIHDILGVRFAVPYYDQVKPAVQEVRKKLSLRNYAVDLNSEGFRDKDHLDNGDANAYRSYHFFLKVPTLIDLYGNSELFLCEVQARTELEHIWAVRSHNLFYKPDIGWTATDGHVKEDMKQISNELRAVDQHLISIRDRVKGQNLDEKTL